MLLDLGLVSECHRWCRRALDLIGSPDAGTVVELRLQEAFAVSAVFTTRNGEDVRLARARGIEVAQSLESCDDEVRLVGHLATFLIRTGEFAAALELAERSFAAARRTAWSVKVEWVLGLSHHMCGGQALAQKHREAGLRRATKSGDSPTMFSHTHAQLTLAPTLWLRGRADRAVTVARSIASGRARGNTVLDA